MKFGLVIYGSLDTLSGGYLYDRKLVEYLQDQGDTIEIISLPWRTYLAHLTDNFRVRMPLGLDLLIQDELNHPSLLAANKQPHSYPVISLIHHLRSSEQHPAWVNWFYHLIEKHYLNSVDGYIFNSQTTREVVNGLIESGKPDVVAHPPTDRFGDALPDTEVLARARQPGPLRILFLGNVIPRKGLHTLLEAVRGQVSAFSLDVIGALNLDIPYANAMQQKATDHCPPSTVHFYGPLDNDALVEKLKAAQVLVVPSSYEGFGIVYLEGMAFGLPAIGTTAGGASEIIREGETGYLIPPGDATTLSARLSALATDRDMLARLSLNALERYRRQPSWEDTASSIRQFLAKMVKL